MAGSSNGLQPDSDIHLPTAAEVTDGDEREKEQTESVATNDSAGRDDSPAPNKKRTRRSTTDAGLQKRVRGRLGSLKGLMKMPIEIFTQIAYLLSPGDLIAVSWSSKFFRNMLLQRSALKMWQHAESNVPGLPPCPVGMSEPQYAALVFTKYCTLCGASATAKPYPRLHVRLCPSCRKDELKEIVRWQRPREVDGTLVNQSTCANLKPEKSRGYGVKPCFALKRTIAEVISKQQEFKAIEDAARLAQWENERRKLVEARRKHGDQLHTYLESVQKSRGDELDSIKQQRRDAITERLKVLGWSDEDFKFAFGDKKQWHALVEVSKPLTERIWGNLLPKLIPLLEDNRERKTAFDKRERRSIRRRRVHSYLQELQHTGHPLEHIVAAFRDELATSSELDEFTLRIYGGLRELYDYRLKDFLPNTRLALDWDCLADLSDREITIEEVEAELKARKAQIEQKLLEWRAGVEQKLVERFQDGAEVTDTDVILTVKGSTELTQNISRGLRLLLRADTVFERKNPEDTGIRQPELEDIPRYYPRLIAMLYEGFYENPWSPPESTASRASQDIDLTKFRRNTKIEGIVKSLLVDLGMPNVTRLELQVMKSRFVCGRCIDKTPKTWDEVVSHYAEQPKIWELFKDKQLSCPVRYPIEFQDVHDLESTTNSKPLVRLLTTQEVEDLGKLKNDPLADRRKCYLCRVTGRASCWLDGDDMKMHLLDVHGVINSLEGIHYYRLDHGVFTEEWAEMWDAFHDSQSSEPGISISL
ncbi:hypothetical protein FRC07_000019 [Ceratobasidium sp. 392]|nr:hypothetical protein FRC07_000019 [Ceratobasidium sp. 392]